MRMIGYQNGREQGEWIEISEKSWHHPDTLKGEMQNILILGFLGHLLPIYPDNPDKNSTSSKYPDLPVRILTSGHHVPHDFWGCFFCDVLWYFVIFHDFQDIFWFYVILKIFYDISWFFMMISDVSRFFGIFCDVSWCFVILWDFSFYEKAWKITGCGLGGTLGV